MPVTVPSASEPTVTCYTKTTWAGSWTEQPLLEALSINSSAAPAHGTATLRFRYGQALLPAIGSRPADTTPATISRGGFIGNYVKITISGLGDWYGVIIDNTDSRHGLIGGTIPSGAETYTAFTLSWFLDQTPILKSRVKHTGGTALIDRVIPFNAGTDGSQRDNRVAWKNYDSTAKCFTDRVMSAAPAAWKAADAIEYILEEFPPQDSTGAELVPFELDAAALTFLDYEIPTVDYNGATPWQVINQLIDRRRGLGFHTVIASSTVKLVVWSQTASVISLPSGSEIPANPNTTTYDFDTSVNILDATVATTLMTRFDQIVVMGERAGSVFTVRPQTNMEPDWSTTQENTYNIAASTKPGYSVLNDGDKEAANNDRRAADDLLRVFSWWRPKRTWTGRSDTDPSTGTAPYALPKISDDGVVTTGTPANIQRAGLRFQPFLPLRQGVTYTTTAIVPESGDADDQEAEFIPPLLLLKTPANRSGGADAGWVHGERLNQSADANSSKRPHTYSVDLAVREDAPGLILRTVGKPQHYLAQNKFVPNGNFESIGGDTFTTDQWLATVYVLQDQFCRAQYPLTADLPTLDLVRKLVIRVTGAFLDYVVPGTILGVDAGELKKTALGGFVRDDRQRLKDIARLAFAWYGQDRRILNLSFRSIVSGFEVGTLITSIGSGGFSETINTAITSVTFDLRAGTTSLHTQFGELDFTV